ncbi:MAG: hypothetical protein ACFE9N_11875 [Promethearchaeota archaeon]
MKGYCYIALIIGFFVFYQQNPVYAVVIIALFVGIFLFFKSRKSGPRGFGFFSGKGAQQQESRMDDLVTLMMIQQLLNTNSQDSDTRVYKDSEKDRKHQIDKIKEEVLNLLDED